MILDLVPARLILVPNHVVYGQPSHLQFNKNLQKYCNQLWIYLCYTVLIDSFIAHYNPDVLIMLCYIPCSEYYNLNWSSMRGFPYSISTIHGGIFAICCCMNSLATFYGNIFNFQFMPCSFLRCEVWPEPWADF